MGNVSWMLELQIQTGRSDDFRSLVQEMVAATQANDPGTMNYEWNTDSEETVCHFYERYADSTTVMVH